MKAALISSYGSADVIQIREMPRPEPAANELLIRLQASSVNPIDWKIRQGQLRFIKPIKFPKILGADFCGQVEALGADVEDFRVGDWVYGMVPALEGGAYAEYLCVKASRVAAKPAQITAEEAAAIPLAGLTALQALEKGRLQAGQTVFINGAAGGVGSFAVQLAKAMGAEVVASCSAQSCELVRSLGADKVLDYKKDVLLPAKPRFSLIFDAHGGLPYRDVRKAVFKDGSYVTTQPYPKDQLLHWFSRLFGSLPYELIWVKANRAELEKMNRFIEAGQLRPVIDSSFPLDQLAEAHRKSEAGHVHGKLLIRISQ